MNLIRLQAPDLEKAEELAAGRDAILDLAIQKLTNH